MPLILLPSPKMLKIKISLLPQIPALFHDMWLSRVKNRFTGKQGFTLIELIITLTVASLLAAMVFPFLSTSLTKSFDPTMQLQDLLALKQVMENITDDFNRGTTLDAMQAAIGAEGVAQNNNYGVYTVVYNRYINFDAGNNEIAGVSSDGILKVTIQYDNEITPAIPTLFVR